MTGKAIVIAEYDPLWPQHFEMLRARLRKLLEGLAETIEHVGSTAVPGLAAKPILDIDVLAPSTAALPAAFSRLAAAGYKHQGDLGIAGREAFETPPGDPPHHLYLCHPGSQEYRRHLLFRDFLRSHPREAQAYADQKRYFARVFGEDREGYMQAKTAFIESALRRVVPPR